MPGSLRRASQGQAQEQQQPATSRPLSLLPSFSRGCPLICSGRKALCTSPETLSLVLPHAGLRSLCLKLPFVRTQTVRSCYEIQILGGGGSAVLRQKMDVALGADCQTEKTLRTTRETLRLRRKAAPVSLCLPGRSLETRWAPTERSQRHLWVLQPSRPTALRAKVSCHRARDSAQTSLRANLATPSAE